MILVSVSSIEDLMRELNVRIEFLGMDIRRAVSEDDDLVYWLLCNNKVDSISEELSPYSPEEIALLRGIVCLKK